MNLSDHFTLEEMLASETAKKRGIPNIPEDSDLPNLIRLVVTCLEPIRLELGLPMKISSGYRCPQLNAAVGGVNNSAHMTGRAADFIVQGMDLNHAWGIIKSMDLPFDQLIWETNRMGSQWIHIAVARDGEEPRKEVLYLQARPYRKGDTA